MNPPEQTRAGSLPAPTDRLEFRRMSPGDLDDMAALRGDPVVMRYYPRVRDRREAADWIRWNEGLYAREGHGLWIITRRDTGEFVGDCGLTPLVVDGVTDVVVGYHVCHPVDLHGRGYVTEAAAACHAYARDVLRVRRLIAIINPDNTASRRVAEKIGLTHERDTTARGGHPIRVYAAAF